jgi:hypothetical protein
MRNFEILLFFVVTLVFVINQSIVYREMEGYVTYIGDNYVIMETPAAEGRNSPRIIIFIEDYLKVQTEK